MDTDKRAELTTLGAAEPAGSDANPASTVDPGARIRDLRTERRIGQKQLAVMAGLSQQGLHKIERGKRQPRLSTVRQLATALGVHPADLLGLSRERRATPAPSTDGTSAELVSAQ